MQKVMELEKAKKLLLEMKHNCINGAMYRDEKAEEKALAIETVLIELETLRKSLDAKESFYKHVAEDNIYYAEQIKKIRDIIDDLPYRKE